MFWLEWNVLSGLVYQKAGLALRSLQGGGLPQDEFPGPRIVLSH